MAEEFKILLGASFKEGTSSGINEQIRDLERRVNPIRLTLDTQSILNKIDNIRQQIQNLNNIRVTLNCDVGGRGNGGQGVQRTVNHVNEAYRDLMNLARRINSIRIQIGGLDSGKSSNQIRELSGQLNLLMDTYNNLYDTFTRGLDTQQLNILENEINDVRTNLEQLQATEALLSRQGIDTTTTQRNIHDLETRLNDLLETYHALSNGLTINQINNLTNTFQTTTDRVSALNARLADVRDNLARKIIINLDTNHFDKEINNLKSNFGKLSNQTPEVRNGINSVRLALEDMNNAVRANDFDGLISAHDRYQNALRETSNQIDILTRSEKDNIAANKLSQDRDVLSSNMSVWLQKNSAAASQFGGSIKDLQKELKNCNNVRFNEIKKEFEKIKNEAILAGKNVKTFGDRLKDSFSKLSTYFSAYELISMASQAIRSMYNNVIEVDTAMTNLYKVTDETALRYEQFLTSASKTSQELGRSLSSFIEQTSNWSKMGFDIGDSEELAKLSSIYANVAEVDDATAVSDLVTVIKAYGIEAKNAVTIVDSLNKISNEFAVTAAGLGEGLTKAAASMATSGTEFEKTIAMLTGIAEITQSPEEAGNFLKVATMRIQGMKGKLEELGEEVDDSVDSISKVQTQILNLTHGEVNIFDDAGEFRDYYEIMEDIADVVDDLTSTDRASLYEILFGKQRANQGAALIKAFQSGQVAKAYKAALDSAGSAMSEQAKWAESLEAKLGSLESAWQNLSNTFLDSDFLKKAIDALTDFVNALDWVINEIGAFNATIGGLFIGNIVKDIMSASSAAGGLSSLLSNSLAKDAGIAKTAISGLWKVIAAHPILAAVGAVGLLVAAFDKIHVSAKEANEKMATAFDEYDGAKQKVIDVNTELATTKSRMEELQRKGGLTFVEQQELKDLREATKLLQIQADLAAQAEIREAKKAAASVEEAYKKNFKYEISQNATDKYKADSEQWNGAIPLGDKSDVSAYIAEISYLTKLRDQAIVARDEVKALRDGTKEGSKEWERYNKEWEDHSYDVEDFNEQIEAATDIVWEQATILSGYAEKLAIVPEEYRTTNQKNLLSDIESIIDYIYQELNPALWKQMQFDEIFNDKNFADAKKELVEIAEANKTVGITVDDITSKYPKLAEAVENAGFEIQDLVDYINSEAGAINVDEYVRQAKEELAESMSEATEEATDGATTDATLGVEVTAEVNKEASLSEINKWLDSLPDEDKVIACDIILNNDTSGWSLDNFKKKLEEAKKSVEDSVEPISFSELMSNEGFNEIVDSHIEKINALQEAYESFKDGDFTNADFVELIREFPELTNHAEDLDVAIEDLLESTNDKFQNNIREFVKQFGKLKTADDVAALENFINATLKLGQVVGSTSFAIDIDVEAGNMKNLYDAINESVSGTGLSSESIKNIENMYSNLEGYDPSKLFELTEHGIHLNVQELRNLQSEYESLNKLEIKNKLQDLKQEYNNAKKELSGLTKGTDEYNQKLLEIEGIENQITDVQRLMAQYEGLTSAYNKWIEAQSTGNENDMYLNLSDSIESAKKLYEEGWIGTDDFRSWVQMMTDVDLSTASIDEILSVYEKGMPAMERFFTGNTNGLLNFLNDAKYVSEQLGEEFVTLGEDGKWHIDFEGIGDEEFARVFSQMTGLQISAEQLQIILRALSAAGFDVNLESAYASVEELQSKVEETEAKLKELGAEPVKIDIYCDDAETELQNAKSIIEAIKNDSSIDVQVKQAMLDDAYAKVDALIARINQPAFMSINVSDVDAELQGALALLQNYQAAVNNVEALKIKGADTSEIEKAKKKVDEYASAVNGLPDTVKTTIGLTDDNGKALADVAAIKEKIPTIEIDTTLNPPDDSSIDGLSENATVTLETQLGDSFDSVGQYVSALNNHVSTMTLEVELGDSFDTAGEAVRGINNHVSTMTMEVELGDSFDTAGNMVRAINDTTSTMTMEVELGDSFDTAGNMVRAISDTTSTMKMEVELGDSFDTAGNMVRAIDNKTATMTMEVELGDSFDTAGNMVMAINDTTSTMTMEVELGNSFDTAGNMVRAIDNTTSTMTAEVELGDSFDTAGNMVRAIDNTVATMDMEVELGDSFDTAGNMIMAINDTVATMTAEVELGDSFDTAGNMVRAIDNKTATMTMEVELGDSFDTAGNMVRAIDNTTSTMTMEVELGDSFDTAGEKIRGINNHVSTITIETEIGDSLDRVGEVISGIGQTISDVTIDVKLADDSLDTIVTTIEDTTAEMTVEATVDQTEVDEFKEDDHTTNGNVIWDNIIKKVTSWANKVKESLGIVNWQNDTKNVKTHFEATGTIHWSDSGESHGGAGRGFVDGTAYAKGTVGKAYKKGDWGTKNSGTALVGELGQELVVRDGRFFTIGDNGAEFFEYERGDIIFNAEQTKQIFEKGKITTGQRRGYAFASGTAFAPGSNAGGQIIVNGKVTTTPSKDSGDGSGDGSGEDVKEFKETFDWIEVAIDRIERAISRLDLKANSIYKSWSSRNKNLKKEISAIEKEISLQERGYERYIQQANSVGLDESLAKKVRNGEINIEDITDEGVAEKVKEYQEW